jgi:asparaginyl-tRNA synthetase
MPHLRSRLPFNSLLLQLRSQVIASLTKFFEESEFVQTHPPILTSSDCEGAGEVFTVLPAPSGATDQSKETGNFFKSPKYLTVSSQLHLEALAQSVGRVWTLSPTFRAERSDTPRHLSEFYMLEAEVAFAQELEDIMSLTERMIQAVAKTLLTSRIGKELIESSTAPDSINASRLQSRWEILANGGWPRIKYIDAIRLLQEASTNKDAKFKIKAEWKFGLQAEHEKYIAEKVGNGGPVFITDYPRHLKAFYMPLSPGQESITEDDELTVSCFDLVVPEVCEIIGGSMRESQLEALLNNMERHGLAKDGKVAESLDWYVDLRRWGTVPHGGFGLGFDRLLCYLAGVSSIRDMVTFPRYYGRCEC